MDKNNSSNSSGGNGPSSQNGNDQSELKGWLKENLSRVSLLGGLLILMLSAGIFLKNRMTPKSDINVEAFQGPAEVSGIIQSECVTVAERISQTLERQKCEEAEAQFFASLEVCKSLGISDEVDSNFADLSISIASCFFKTKQDGARAADNLKKTQEQVEGWEIQNGPITCPAERVVAAYVQAYTEPRDLKCDDNSVMKLIEKLKAKDFSSLKEFLIKGETSYQGFIRADSYCPDTSDNVIKTLEQMTQGKTIEVTEAKSSEAQNTNVGTGSESLSQDKYIEITSAGQKLFAIHLKASAGGCYYFAGILVDSKDTGDIDP